MPTIVWTKIDEAPALASYSLLPIVEDSSTGRVLTSRLRIFRWRGASWPSFRIV